MAITRHEVLGRLTSVGDKSSIAIGDGGLALVEVDENGIKPRTTAKLRVLLCNV